MAAPLSATTYVEVCELCVRGCHCTSGFRKGVSHTAQLHMRATRPPTCTCKRPSFLSLSVCACSTGEPGVRMRPAEANTNKNDLALASLTRELVMRIHAAFPRPISGPWRVPYHSSGWRVHMFPPERVTIILSRVNVVLTAPPGNYPPMSMSEWWQFVGTSLMLAPCRSVHVGFMLVRSSRKVDSVTLMPETRFLRVLSAMSTLNFMVRAVRAFVLVSAHGFSLGCGWTTVWVCVAARVARPDGSRGGSGRVDADAGRRPSAAA